MKRRAVVAAIVVAAGSLSACTPDWGGAIPSSTTTTTVPGTPQSTTFVYAGPAGNCDGETVLTGVRVRPCQGLANTTTSVIVTTKVLDPQCINFYGYYDVTKVMGTAKQGTTTKTITQTDTTPGTPVFDTGFDVAAGPITVTISDLRVDLAGGLRCGWFG